MGLMKHLMAYEAEPVREFSVIKDSRGVAYGSDVWLRALIGKFENELDDSNVANTSCLIAVLLAQVRPSQYPAKRRCPKLRLKRRRGPPARAPPGIRENSAPAPPKVKVLECCALRECILFIVRDRFLFKPYTFSPPQNRVGPAST
jgi:hypothetical protein